MKGVISISLKQRGMAALMMNDQLEEKIIRQQRLVIDILVFAALLLLVVLAVVYRKFQIKNRANCRMQILMQDLHHRVKNNLQILSGLFTMQMGELIDESTKNTLRENELRLTAMNLIHHQLYLHSTDSQIEMSGYLAELLAHIKDTFGNANIQLRTLIEPLLLKADKAVVIGLIINELATNAIKHAFDENGGEIYLSLKQEKKSKLVLVLSDNGIRSFNKTINEKGLSFGLKLVNLLVKQLNAKLIRTQLNGTCYQIEMAT